MKHIPDPTPATNTESERLGARERRRVKRTQPSGGQRLSVPLHYRSRSLIAAVVAELASYRSSLLSLTGEILAAWTTQQQWSALAPLGFNGLAIVVVLRRAMRGNRMDWEGFCLRGRVDVV